MLAHSKNISWCLFIFVSINMPPFDIHIPRKEQLDASAKISP